MIKNIDTRWQKVPPENSPEYKELMGHLMKNLKNAIVSIKITNPEYAGFRSCTRAFLRRLETNRGRDAQSIISIVGSTYGLGRIMYDLQPHLIPWVKISKAKIAFHFRRYLIEAVNKNTNRRYSNVRTPWVQLRTRDGVLKYLSILGMKKLDDSYYRVPQIELKDPNKVAVIRKIYQKYPSRCIALCKNADGRARIGQIDYDWRVTLDTRVWCTEGKLRWNDSKNMPPSYKQICRHREGNSTPTLLDE